MFWLNNLFFENTPLQAIVILAIIISTGLYLGKLKVYGVSLGVTFVFFMGILMGHLGFSIDHQMLIYAEDFGLVIFVYELGLQVGPGFFSSFKKGGMKLNMLGLGLVFLGTMLAVALSYTLNIPMSDMVGILCGATTNTPALGAAQQTLEEMNLPSISAALSCAVTYPMGVIGVILAMITLRKLFVRPSDITADEEEQDETFVAAFRVHNPAIIGKSIREVAQISGRHFVISRLWRDGKVTIPESGTLLRSDDKLLIVTTPEDVPNLTMMFGMEELKDWNKKDIDWNAIDSQLISKHIVISRPEINGKKLGALKLRNSYDINITRVMRSGIQLLATPGLILQLGDRLTVVGERQAIENVERLLGNKVRTLKDPNLATVFFGIILGLIIGAIPIAIPGISQPVKLGLAGGPIIVGILIGRFGPRFHLITYTTRSANLMLRGLGIALYLACLGLDSGAHFFDTVIRPEGVIWIALGFLITFMPVVIMGALSLRMSKVGFGNTCGMLCGSMANPMALGYANDTLPGDSPAVSYATVYPLSMFVRVIIAQLLVMVFC
ncbi:putative transporter [Phocaeicola oris]|uniref:putative transporter n=1 Tax=Phocaeicola oris TaxID=2896850 RepID=UPI00234F653E|nr:putative transporter [Phocaeicola oris]MCE2615617.1 putative transporter [Phocaeicola oris]